MEYIGTRSEGYSTSSANAILQGLAPCGGLFVPRTLPNIDFSAHMGASYPQLAALILKTFLPDYDAEFIKSQTQTCYGQNFNNKAGHLVEVAPQMYSLELWHGPTSAFKDYALQIMPRLLVQARQMLSAQGKTIILVATSGDTGSAALAGYKDLPGIQIAVFYPKSGTSRLQQLQMTTMQGENLAVYAVNGNFDDAQRGVKTAFGNTQLANTLWQNSEARLSSANSINWGRLVPQIVYYVSSYLSLCASGSIAYGEPVDYCVPTGNFGNIMAGWYAKQMGLPIGRLVCAANKNNVLADFISTGTYNIKREFHKTSSPSMDILVSSNLERLLYHISGSSALVSDLMQQLTTKGHYTVPSQILETIQQTFKTGWATEDEVFAEVNTLFNNSAYLCDPHTAVAFCVGRRHLSENGAPMVVVSTASPYKFGTQVLTALNQNVPSNEFEALRQLQNYTATQAPQNLVNLEVKQERFTDTINPEDILNIPLKL